MLGIYLLGFACPIQYETLKITLDPNRISNTNVAGMGGIQAPINT